MGKSQENSLHYVYNLKILNEFGDSKKNSIKSILLIDISGFSLDCNNYNNTNSKKRNSLFLDLKEFIKDLSKNQNSAVMRNIFLRN